MPIAQVSFPEAELGADSEDGDAVVVRDGDLGRGLDPRLAVDLHRRGGRQPDADFAGLAQTVGLAQADLKEETNLMKLLALNER